MKALVTGGGGFLGRTIVQQLIESGWSVRSMSRSPHPDVEKMGALVLCGDCRDPSFLKQACRGVDAVFHTAAIAGIWGSRDEYYSINTQGTLNVIRACIEEGVGRLIYTSSPSVVFDGEDHILANESLPYPKHYLQYYSETKALAEREVLSSHDDKGLRTIALRPHLIFGVGDPHLLPRLLDRAKKKKLVQVGSGENHVDMVHVKNAAWAHLLAEQNLRGSGSAGGKAYFITNGSPVKLWEFIRQLLEKCHLPPVRYKLPESVAYSIGNAFEKSYHILKRKTEPPMTRFVALQLSRNHTYSIEQAQQDLGYRPLVSMTAGMDEYIKDYLAK